MLCWGLADWAGQRHLPQAVLPAAAAAAILVATLITYRQIGYWSTDLLLWSHSAQVTSNNWKAEYLWGAALDKEGLHTEAVQHYFRAAAIYPADPFLDLSIASYEHQHGNPALAIEYYKKALPGAWNSQQRAQTLSSMAAAYRLMGDNASADECLARIAALPQRTVNWQGEWWKQILPMLRQWFHGGDTKPQS
jgi:tetratricopeptide (TPR) repeat protein